MSIGFMIVTFFSRRIFISQIMREIYQTKYNRGLPHQKAKIFEDDLSVNGSLTTLKRQSKTHLQQKILSNGGGAFKII